MALVVRLVQVVVLELQGPVVQAELMEVQVHLAALVVVDLVVAVG